MWYKFLEIQNEVKKEDKAYRVRILSVRYGIEGMEVIIWMIVVLSSRITAVKHTCANLLLFSTISIHSIAVSLPEASPTRT